MKTSQTIKMLAITIGIFISTLSFSQSNYNSQNMKFVYNARSNNNFNINKQGVSFEINLTKKKDQKIQIKIENNSNRMENLYLNPTSRKELNLYKKNIEKNANK